MNLTRQRLRRLNGPVLTLDELLFGQDMPPTDELAIDRQGLIERYRKVMAEFGEPNGFKLWTYLGEELEKYKPETDGQSKVLTLVQEIQEHCRKEEHARSTAVARAKGQT